MHSEIARPQTGKEPSARCQKKRRRSGERIAVVMSRFFRQTDWNV